MSAPNLQTICLEQYVRSTQDTDNDPIYTKLREKKKEIDARCEKLKHNSNEYKNYNKANEVFEKAKKTFEQAENTFKKAEEIYNEFKSNLDQKQTNELDVVRNSAAQEKQIMMELVDPNQETFNQCLDCKKIIQRKKFHSYASCHKCLSKRVFVLKLELLRMLKRQQDVLHQLDILVRKKKHLI